MVQVNTPEAEGAQALFCYIADALGYKQAQIEFAPYYKSKDSKGFFKKHKKLIDEAYSANRVDTERTKERILDYIENNDDWFISSMRIAETILGEVKDISSKFTKINSPGWQNLFYTHGDDEVMKVMSNLFKSANNQSAKAGGGRYFGDLNKWSPADIYFATAKAKKTLKDLENDSETKKNNLTFAKLNETTINLIEKAELLPLSLKKVNKMIVIKKVNFDRKTEEKLLADTYCEGVKKWNPMQGDFNFKNAKFTMGAYSGGRDIRVLIESGSKKGDLQFRHTPASNGRPSKGFKTVLSYKGASALGGQVVGIPLLSKVIASVDKDFASKITTIFASNYTKFETAMNRYNDYGGGKKRYQSGDKQLKKIFNDDVGAISALTIMNPLRVEIEKYFKNPKEQQHNVARAIFAYTASRTPMSSPFVIAKD
tara:strand:- start:416 stop:1696 length:1281 start_codon:yes stop_codon:yes gene_type:complete